MQQTNTLREINLDSSAVTIGMFDGVHIGHQQIIQRLKAKSSQVGVPSCLITFHPHPAFILRKLNEPFYLTLPHERAAILLDLGIDHVIILPFSRELSSQTPDQFIGLINRHLNIKHICVGEDFALGKHRTGDHHTLTQIGKHLGYSLETVAPVLWQGEKVSSSFIRQVIKQGQVDLAAKLLSRAYVISGNRYAQDEIIVSGESLTHLQTHYEAAKIAPKNGLYAAGIVVNDALIPAIVELSLPELLTPDADLMFEVYILGKIALQQQTLTIRFQEFLSNLTEPGTSEEKFKQLVSALKKRTAQ